MRVLHILSASAALFVASVSCAVYTASAPPDRCATEVVASTTYIGQDSNVMLQTSHCDDEPILDSDGEYVPVGLLNRRQSSTDVCGAQCMSLSLQ